MGCRPSRRAVACVRVAGEGGGGGPWGVCQSSLPSTSASRATGDGVRLRQRAGGGHRRNGDGGGRGEGVNPRDRYSAPPMDRHFPPHSCTSATYERGCHGTSRITLRLSKNGSTLEIEKCDFQHDRTSCEHCGPGAGETSTEDSDPYTPMRTRSAPDLSAASKKGSCRPPPRPPRHTKTEAAQMDSNPPPLPPRHRLTMVASAPITLDSSPGSVRTATKVEVEVESLCGNLPFIVAQPSSVHSFNETVDVHVESGCMPSGDTSPDLPCANAQNANEPVNKGSQLPKQSLVSVASENVSNTNAQNTSPLPDLEQTLKIIQQVVMSSSAQNNHNMADMVDVTALHSTNSGLLGDDVDLNLLHKLGCQECRLVHTVHTGAGDASCTTNRQTCLVGADNSQKQARNVRVRPDNCQARADNHQTGTGNCCERCARLSPFSENHDGISVSSATPPSAEFPVDGRPIPAGSTDYRVLMLGAGCSDITSRLTSDPCSDTNVRLLSAAITHTGGAIGPGVSDSQMTHDMAASDSHSTGATNVRRLKRVVSRLEGQSDDSTDTGCESDEESERSQVLARIEMVPAYVHTDFRNDFGDLFDDDSSTAGLDFN